MRELIDHATGKKCSEITQFAGGWLNFTYNTPVGRIILKTFLLRPWVWKITGWWQASPFTRKKADRYAQKYNVDKNQFEQSNWRSFNDFFVRKYKSEIIPYSKNKLDVIAVAEATISYYEISDSSLLTIKGRKYHLADVVGSEELAKEFNGGVAILYHLSVHNYHRFWFPDDGVMEEQYQLPGMLHTVSSISKKYPIYSVNQRSVSVLNVKSIGCVLMVEIGAMMVGKIVNRSIKSFSRGQEKGHFEIGGSSILMVYKKDTIKLDSIIERAGTDGMDVLIKIGETIGKYV